MIKKASLALFFGLVCLLSYSQQIGGVINHYTEVLAYEPCDNSLLVNNALDFKVGDTVVIIQMKGAIIDSSNTAAFGTITDYKNAGNYEFNYISGKTGNRLQLKNRLLKAYDIPFGKVQLVRVPYYKSVTITSPLTCLAWDGGKGGILVLNVEQTIDMQAGIDLSGKGFRGGILETQVSDCNDAGFFYGATSTRAGLKGEGIVELASDKVRGRGAAANGGGSGNDHNSGGAGGANGGAGGNGGKEYVCVSLQLDNGGIGGKALSYNPASRKIFLGGGGGAADANNGHAGNAGSGGGIALIRALTIVANNNSIISNGTNGADCTGDCWDGQSGGGAGGTVVLDYTTLTGPLQVNTNGGNGGNLRNNNTTFGYNGPGGGGGGGVLWISEAALPAAIVHSSTGGVNGVFLNNNRTDGASAGTDGLTLFNAATPFSSTLFSKNIDSVRIDATRLSCAEFSFQGLGYTRISPIVSWEWTLGDGNNASTQDVTHTYQNSSNYTVKLVGTDGYGCKDSITTNVIMNGQIFDFSYTQDACNPLNVQFTGLGDNLVNSWWSLGDGNIITGNTMPAHTYAGFGSYPVRFFVQGGCDTVTKIIAVNVLKTDFVITPDTTICYGTTKQLRAKNALSYCWTPTTGLDNPATQNPVTNTTQNITYFLTAQVPTGNLIVNGDFSAGNTGFTSAYNYTTPNTTEAEIFVGTNPRAWNPNMSACGDHTTGTGNMLLVNGAPQLDVEVWRQTVAVVPNTNYAFSTWIVSTGLPNQAELQFSINGNNLGAPIIGAATTCIWNQFFTTWNSGNNTTAVISIVNRNLIRDGNDFALDDISFAAVSTVRDSVTITVDKLLITANNDTTVCNNDSVHLSATGAVSYTWSPAANISNPNIANPVVKIISPNQFIVTGTNASGCSGNDTVNIYTHPLPSITKTNDTAVCKNVSLQLNISGGISYLWSPAATLSNASIANPVASPNGYTKYYVQITDAYTCTHSDSVEVDIIQRPVFSVSPNAAVCDGADVTLGASGGDSYAWSPAASLNDASVPEPVAAPNTTTTYTVHIAESRCNYDTTLTVTITVNPNPVVTAQKSNDIDCSKPTAQLTAAGANTWLWTPATGLNYADRYNPVAAVDTTTVFEVTGSNNFGCSAKDTVTVKVSKDNVPLNPVPNAFTPNHDGRNDCFGISRWGFVTLLEFSVYNRWGEKIFTTKDPRNCWDGTYKGKNQDTGGYAYVIRARALCGEVKRTGIVMLIR